MADFGEQWRRVVAAAKEVAKPAYMHISPVLRTYDDALTRKGQALGLADTPPEQAQKDDINLWNGVLQHGLITITTMQDVGRRLDRICDSSKRGRLNADEAMEVVDFYRKADLQYGLVQPYLKRFDALHSENQAEEIGAQFREEEERGLKTLVRSVKQDSLLEFRGKFMGMKHIFWSPTFREDVLKGVRDKGEAAMNYDALIPRA